MAFSKRVPRGGAFSKAAAQAEPVDEASAAPAYSSRADEEEPFPAPGAQRLQPAQPAGLRGGDDDDEWWR